MTAPQTASAVTVPAANAHTDSVPQPATVEAPTPRTSSCRQCGGNPHAILDAFKAGVRAGIWESYRPNLEATATREATQHRHEWQQVERWHE